MLLEARKIIECLFSRGGQAASGGLLLDEQLALPEKIKIAALFVRQIDAVLKARDPAAGDAKRLEKFIIESLRLAALVTGVLPFRGEFRRARFDIVPIETHGPIESRKACLSYIAKRMKSAVIPSCV